MFQWLASLEPIVAVFVRSMFLTVNEGLVDDCNIGKYILLFVYLWLND